MRSASALAATVGALAAWQRDAGPVHLHPGDLGWGAMAGQERLASRLRTWSRDGEVRAIGFLDGEDLLRLAIDPRATADAALAARIAEDICTPGSGVLDAPHPAVEARGASALRAALTDRGWVKDEPWTTFRRDLTAPVDDGAIHRTGLRVTAARPEDAESWMAVHRSAFAGAVPAAQELADLARRWVAMVRGPLARDARQLLARDAQGTAVAIIAVWGAGRGRPGLLEPMGVHADHQGRGYATAITLAGVRALQEMGASSTVVGAENSNLGAMASYAASGFAADPSIRDLVPGR